MLAIGQWFGACYKAAVWCWYKVVVWCLLYGSGLVLAMWRWLGFRHKGVILCLLYGSGLVLAMRQ